MRARFIIKTFYASVHVYLDVPELAHEENVTHFPEGDDIDFSKF